MDTNNRKIQIKIKFALFYLLSVAIILFIYSVVTSNTEANAATTSANPLDEGSLPVTNTVSRLEYLNSRYRNLKPLDLQFAKVNGDSVGAEGIYDFDSTSVQEEMRFTKSLDSLAKIAHALPDRQEGLRLQNFIESYRMALEDRLAMQNFYKNAPAPAEEPNDNSQQMIQQLQYEIKARNKHIAELENKVYALQKKTGLP